MKFSSDIGPQVLPSAYGQETTKPGKLPDTAGSQINGGPNAFVNPVAHGGETFARLPARSGFFPAATGVPGQPNVRRVDAYQGGPGGQLSPFMVRRGWTFGF